MLLSDFGILMGRKNIVLIVDHDEMLSDDD